MRGKARLMSDRFADLRVQQQDTSPFLLLGGQVGVLLLHGFSGTPREMRPLGEYLRSAGLSAYAPLLPGHGGTLDEINRASWRLWASYASDALQELGRECDTLFVAGFSMGSLLALWLAEQPETSRRLSGVLLYSPALRLANRKIWLTPLARYFVASLPKDEESDLHDSSAEAWLGGFAAYPVPAAAELWQLNRAVRRKLSHVQLPCFVAYASGDKSIHPTSGPETVRWLSQQTQVETLVLHNSGHAVVVDAEWKLLAKASLEFIRSLTAPQ